MGKLVTILGGCLAVAGGMAYGLHTYNNDGCEYLSGCSLKQSGCCGLKDLCPLPTDGTVSSDGMALAGPVALFVTTPVKAEVGGCCAAKVIAHAECGSEVLTPAVTTTVIAHPPATTDTTAAK